MTIWADDVRAPILAEIGGRFTAETGTPVTVSVVDLNDIADELVNEASSGVGPDLVYGANEWLGRLIEAGAVEPLDPALGGKAASFAQVGLDAFHYGGALYGMPYLGEAAALYYNSSLVPSPPQTWTEMETMAKQMQDAGEVVQGFCLAHGDPYHSYSILTGFDGYLFGKTADGSYDFSDVGLDSQGGLASARQIADMLESGLLSQSADYATCQTLMANGRAAFWITGPWAMTELMRAHDQSGLQFAVAAIPTMAKPPRPLVGVTGFMVGKFGLNKDSAVRFLTDFVATDDTMTTLWQADPRSPIWKPLADAMTDPNAIAFTKSAASGDPMPSTSKMQAIWQAWADALNQIFAGAQDPAQAYVDAAAKIRALTAP